MKRIIILLICFITFSRNNFANEILKKTISDTSRIFKIDNFWIYGNEKFEYISLVNSSNDTLKLMACSEFLCSPFGKIKNQEKIKASLLKKFKVIETKKNTSNTLGKYTILSLKSNFSSLNLLFSNYTGKSRYSYVTSGNIVDSVVLFDNKIKIGMSIEKFYTQFFNNFPNDLKQRYSVIIFSPCIDNIPTHIYSFKSGKLTNVKFE